MDCTYVKEIMAAFLSGTLDEGEGDLIGRHLIQCPNCQKEMDAYKTVWEMLGEWRDQEPDRSYLSRFWERLSAERHWKDRILEILRPVYTDKKFVFTCVSIVLMVISFTTFRISRQMSQTEMLLTALSAEEIEFVQNLELAENLELLEQMDMLEEMDDLAEKNDSQRGRYAV